MKGIQRALDENGNIVFIDNAIQGGETKYFCEICHKELIIKATNSEKRRKHFAHKKGTSCTDNWSSHDISEWHLQWQEKFPKEYREVPVGDVNERHRADVNVLLSVVEFQHSPISYEDFVRRNRFYTEHHYDVIWVFDGDTFINKEWVDDITPKWYTRRLHKFKRTQNQFKEFCKDSKVVVYFQMQDKLYKALEITPRDVCLVPTDININNFAKKIYESELNKLDERQKEMERIKRRVERIKMDEQSKTKRGKSNVVGVNLYLHLPSTSSCRSPRL